MLSLLYAITASAIISGSLGFAAGFFCRRRLSNANQSPSSVPTVESADENLKDKHQIDSLMVSLQDLTSQVDQQVGQHSLRVGEITDSLDLTRDEEPQRIADAGKQLTSANVELQTQLSEAKAEIQRQRNELRRSIREARTDALTGLPNRRAFDFELLRSLAFYRRKSVPFSLILLDIDHFKLLNDEHGHMVGDQVLKAFARCLLGTFRESDLVTRFGGEEFAVILPQTSLSEALISAERTRLAIAECRYSVGEAELQVTASIGIKQVVPGENETELIRLTDEALYAAKRGGRNCCYYHDGTAPQCLIPDAHLLPADGSVNPPET